jgi:nicotinate phosphoribosyltransferase
MATSRRTRLDPSVFHLPVERMREGYYSDKYFVRAREILLADHHSPNVTMQVFGKSQAYLGGMDEAIAILKLCSDDWRALTVRALYDGDPIEPWETVMTIEGPYQMFAHLETLYLGVLARRTRVGTNTRLVVDAAHPKTVMFFPARHDHWLVQTGDGYAAHIAGAIGVSTDAQASWWGSTGIGTVPHALIAAYDGNTVLATKKFAEFIDPSVQIITLVDYENDCVRTSLEVARAMDGRLWAVRLDSSENLVDLSIIPQMGTFRPTGVNPPRTRRGRLPRRADHGLRRLHRRKDSRVRGGRRARGLLRRRFVALFRTIRLHGRHRLGEWRAAVQSGTTLPAESASRARRVALR